jgi:hypothetical protein
MTQVHATSSQSNQTASLLLTLSIGLQLLAFFVVLNAGSTPDLDRTRAVVASVKQSFSAQPAAADAATAGAAKSAAQTALRTSISDAFSPVLIGRDVIVRVDGDLMWVTAPAAAFFEPDTGRLRAVLPVLDRVVAALAAPAPGVRYELMVALSGPANEATLAAAQAGVMAEDLLRRGLPPAALSLGTLTDEQRSVTLTFIVLSDDDASSPSLRGLS